MVGRIQILIGRRIFREASTLLLWNSITAIVPSRETRKVAVSIAAVSGIITSYNSLYDVAGPFDLVAADRYSAYSSGRFLKSWCVIHSFAC
jgi:hypothetical protein